MSVLDVLGGVMGSLSTPLNFASTLLTNSQNERLMRESWAREDNAMQRKVADLKAAGLNPVLAAGSPAASSGPIRLEAPQVDPSAGSKMLAARAASAQYATTVADAKRAMAQARTAEAEASLAEARARTLLTRRSEAGGRDLSLAEAMAELEFSQAQAQVEGRTAQTALTGTNMDRALLEMQLRSKYGESQEATSLITEILKTVFGGVSTFYRPGIPGIHK